MSRSNHRLRTVVTVVIALLVVAAMVAPAALAHAELRSSDPADGSTLAGTDQVVLTFSEDINPDFVQLVVDGPSGSVVDGEPDVDGPVVTQAIAPSGPGAHSLTYRVVSADGHPVSGSVGFTLTDPVDSAAAPEPAPAATSEPPTTPQRPTVMSGDQTPAGGPEDLSADESGMMLSPLAWLGVVAVLAALVGAGAWLTRRRRHPEH